MGKYKDKIVEVLQLHRDGYPSLMISEMLDIEYETVRRIIFGDFYD